MSPLSIRGQNQFVFFASFASFLPAKAFLPTVALAKEGA